MDGIAPTNKGYLDMVDFQRLQEYERDELLRIKLAIVNCTRSFTHHTRKPLTTSEILLIREYVHDVLAEIHVERKREESKEAQAATPKVKSDLFWWHP